jgi:AcrR family transcriptional regulator
MVIPTPVQARAVSTVERAIAATAALIEEVGAERVRLADVSKRSGVSNGSLIHHFGSLETLLGAAHVVRYEQAVHARIERAADFVRSGGDGRAVLEVLDQFATDTVPGSVRHARLRALSHARHRPEVREMLGGLIRGVRDRLSELLDQALAAGSLARPVDAGAVAVFLQTYALGRCVDELLEDPLPSAEWSAFFRAVVSSGFVEDPSEALHVRTGSEPGVAALLPAGTLEGAHDPLPTGIRWRDADEERVFLAARERYRAGGASAIVARELIAAAGVSNGWFSRRFFGRDGLIDLLHLDALLRLAPLERGLISHVIGGAGTGRELVGCLVPLMLAAATPGLHEDWWDRVDLIVAAREREWLRTEAGAVLRQQIDGVAEVLADAQARGVVRADLSPQAIARFLWGVPIGAILNDLAGLPVGPLAVFTAETFAGFVVLED